MKPYILVLIALTFVGCNLGKKGLQCSEDLAKQQATCTDGSYTCIVQPGKLTCNPTPQPSASPSIVVIPVASPSPSQSPGQ